MAIQVSIVGVPNGPEAAGAFIYHVKEFLVNSIGWTVAGSSNGTSGGMDSVDRIVSPTTITSTVTWVVLESPHVNASDRIQILFGKASTNDLNGRFRYNPEADWVGNTTALPTSAYASGDTWASNIMPSSADARIHILADDVEPYGFHAVATRVSSTGQTINLSLIPLDFGAPTSPGKPYIFRSDTSCNFAYFYLATGTAVVQPDGPPAAPVGISAAGLYNSTGLLAPNGTPQTLDGKDQGSPMIWISPTEYAGVSTFMQWTGTSRADFSTLGDNTFFRGRIVLGDISLPWDGVTIPDTSAFL